MAVMTIMIGESVIRSVITSVLGGMHLFRSGYRLVTYSYALLLSWHTSHWQN